MAKSEKQSFLVFKSIGLFAYSSGFTMKENNNKTTVDTMNTAPNIDMGILKTGRSWRTRFEGRASA